MWWYTFLALSRWLLGGTNSRVFENRLMRGTKLRNLRNVNDLKLIFIV